ncbi:glucose-1-phosphate thymidylyltransferase [Streptosporangium sp. NPDC050855]|uniref:glucose-1-phosphate thymidylyltransferase n=1 Tax=Streptosporangium sp. NPDC050855 TaxID=3366194 RepID=UPI00378DF0D4
MKALVLSGGSGTRLRPFSYSMPKQLIPIAGRPVLEHVLDDIRGLGVREVGIVVGTWSPEIERAIGDGSRLGLRVTYIRQERPLGLAHCVRLGRPFLGDDDFVMYLGDNMLPDGVADIAASFRAERPAAQVVVQRVADPRAFGVAEVEPDGTVRRLVEKPRHPRSDLALVGVYFFTPAVHAAAEAVTPGARGELEITDAIQLLIDRGATVRAGVYGGYWKDTGRIEDVLECNRHLLGGLRTEIAGEVDPLSSLSGPVVVAPGARVVRSRIVGPVIVGPGTLVEDSRIGPDVSLGAGCVLRGTGLSGSIVMDEASISGIDRLQDSLIGRAAVIAPRRDEIRHRLVIGDHTRVEIAA